MLAKLSGPLPADDERWAYEMKWDGIRGLAFIEQGKLRLMTRNQIEVTRRYPELVGLASALGNHSAILDGEIVGFDDQGKPRFEALQQRMGLEGGHHTVARPGVPIAYMVFDVLYLDGDSLLNQPYEVRRAKLEALHLESEHWQTPPSVLGNGEAMLQASKEPSLEGVLAQTLGESLRAQQADWRLDQGQEPPPPGVRHRWLDTGRGPTQRWARFGRGRLLPGRQADLSRPRWDRLLEPDVGRDRQAARTAGPRR